MLIEPDWFCRFEFFVQTDRQTSKLFVEILVKQTFLNNFCYLNLIVSDRSDNQSQKLQEFSPSDCQNIGFSRICGELSIPLLGNIIEY